MKYGLKFTAGGDVVGGDFMRVGQTPAGLVTEQLLGTIAFRITDEAATPSDPKLAIASQFDVARFAPSPQYVPNPHDIETDAGAFMGNAVTALRAILAGKRVLQARGQLEVVSAPLEQVRDSGLIVVSTEPLVDQSAAPGEFKAFVANPDEIDLFNRLAAHAEMLVATPPDVPGHYI